MVLKTENIEKYSGIKIALKGCIKMGETVHPFSFVNGEGLENNKITPQGKIDFDSDWGGKKIQEGIDNSNGIVDYALTIRHHLIHIKRAVRHQWQVVVIKIY